MTRSVRLCCAVVASATAALGATGAGNSLVDAVKQRDTAAIHEFLTRQQTDVNMRAVDGSTALHWAVHLDDASLVRSLLQKGADVHAANRHGVTALVLACENGSPDVVRLLLEAGADPNVSSGEGESALMTAARTGNVEVIDQLIARGARVNEAESWRGQTSLMWAAAEGHLPAVNKLLAAGAEVNARSKAGFTALTFAVRESHPEVARALLKAGGNVNETLPPRERRRTGANEFGAAEGGSSLLDVAILSGHFELAAMLLDAGADPNAAGPGWTPLHTITWVRRPGYGSNDPAPRGSGNMDSLELIRKMAAKGADLNARMKRRTNAGLSALNMVGATPFLMAARTGDAPMMRLLAELGADPLLPNADGTTPLMVAAGVGTRSPGEDAGTEEEVLEAVKAAIELGNDINAVDKKGETAMHGAAYRNMPGVVEYLDRQGADVNVWNRKNASGWTPLRIAAGVHRTGNFRSSEPTAAAIRKVLSARQVTEDAFE